MKNLSIRIISFTLAIVYSIAFFAIHGNYVFGIMSMILFLYVNYLYIKRDSNYSIISFEFLFFISFFLASVVFPILPLEDTNLYWISKIYGEMHEGARWRFFSLSLSAYYIYMLGLVMPKNRVMNRNRIRDLVISDSFLNVSSSIAFFLIIYFYYAGGMHLMDRYTGGLAYFEKFGGVLSYITVMYTISSVVVAIKWGQSRYHSLSFLLSSKCFLFLVNSALILPIILLSGYRSQFLQLIIPLIYLYVFFVNKISNKKLMLLFVIGFGLMVLIGMTRGGDEVTGGHDIVYYLRDFLIDDVAGIWLVDYTDTHGPTGGSNAILQMVSFIPFMGGLVESLIGTQNIALSSSRIFTFSYDTDGSGLGTNIIGDLYYTFGFFGVMFFMFLLGYIIRKLTFHGSIYSLVCYLLLLGNSVFASRVEYFYMVRKVGLSLIIILLITLVAGKPMFNKKIIKSIGKLHKF